MTCCCPCITLEVVDDELSLDVLGPPTVDFDQSEYIPMGSVSGWDGPYEATPTQSEQVFQVGGYTMREAFTVHPIPSNYGLITYSGSVLTVS